MYYCMTMELTVMTLLTLTSCHIQWASPTEFSVPDTTPPLTTVKTHNSLDDLVYSYQGFYTWTRFCQHLPSNKLHDLCSEVHPCGNGYCSCCTDQNNMSYADCSQHEGLASIPPLPLETQVLLFNQNRLYSENITGGFFDGVPNLTHLYLGYNNLNYFHRSMLSRLTQLLCLNVDGNLGLGDNPESINELLAIPGLFELSANMCGLPLDDVGVSFFGGTNKSSVLFLSVYDNMRVSDSSFNMTGLAALPELICLVASFDHLSEVYTSLPLYIETLIIRFNNLGFPKTCSDEGVSLFPILSWLSLWSNSVGIPTVSFPAELQASRLNYHTNWNEPLFKTICLYNLRVLDLRMNPIGTVTSGTFSAEFFPNLQYLNLSQINAMGEHLKLENNSFTNPSLLVLRLEENDLLFRREDLVSSYAFAGCENLKELYLDKNSFLHVDEERFQALFGGLQSLETLSLSECQLEVLFTSLFKTFTKLTHLYLGGNSIAFISDNALEPLRPLQWLDLSDNKLTYVSEQAFSASFRHNPGAFLDLSKNPFVCSCDLVWLADWYRANPERFKATQVAAGPFQKRSYIDISVDLTCENLHDLSLANFSLARQACLLSEQTSVLITYTCSLLVVALTTFLLLFAYRWHFRLLLYEAFRGNGQARRLRLQQNNFNYDVFVSYASEDLPWVRRHLMPQLEDRLGLRLCIHERDFTLGHNIVDNIAESVESSKKILMVFSKSFLLSQWCQFELTYCLSHVLEYDDSLIIVCVDDVVSREMTSAMMAVLKTTTYIQWAEEEYYATTSFWGRIKIALHEILNIGEHVV